MRYVVLLSLLSMMSMSCLCHADSPQPQAMSLWSGRAPAGGRVYTDEDPTMTVYRPAKPNGVAVVICPGGGYGGLAIEPEGHGIARWLNQHGIVGVVLKYRLPKGRTMVPLMDALQAMRMTRANAKAWGVDPAKIGVMGFSAGGHLASTVATQFDSKAGLSPKSEAAKGDGDLVGARPDFAILIYPVITMGKQTHGGSKRNLLGAAATPELAASMSSELQVTRKTPPCFLAHAVDDKPVPPVNSRLFYQALKDKGVEAKYLELPSGGHGLNGYKGPSWDAWQKQSLEWIDEVLTNR